MTEIVKFTMFTAGSPYHPINIIKLFCAVVQLIGNRLILSRLALNSMCGSVAAFILELIWLYFWANNLLIIVLDAQLITKFSTLDHGTMIYFPFPTCSLEIVFSPLFVWFFPYFWIIFSLACSHQHSAADLKGTLCRELEQSTLPLCICLLQGSCKLHLFWLLQTPSSIFWI